MCICIATLLVRVGIKDTSFNSINAIALIVTGLFVHFYFFELDVFIFLLCQRNSVTVILTQIPHVCPVLTLAVSLSSYPYILGCSKPLLAIGESISFDYFNFIL